MVVCITLKQEHRLNKYMEYICLPVCQCQILWDFKLMQACHKMDPTNILKHHLKNIIHLYIYIYTIFTYAYDEISEYNSNNPARRKKGKVRWGFEESNSRGCNRLIIQIEKHNVCLSPACIFSCQQVFSIHTCNHYLHTAGLPQWNTVPCCDHGVLHGLESNIAFSRKTKTKWV